MTDVPVKKNNTITDYGALGFDSEASSKSGCKWNMKISSWSKNLLINEISDDNFIQLSCRNVDGLRACIKKDGIKFFHHEKPDIICLQEIKCSKDKLPAEITVSSTFVCSKSIKLSV